MDDTNELKTILETTILPRVTKPGRYTNQELNSIHKTLTREMVAVALAYPDIYEIGMSNTGLSILYHILNQEPDIVAERTYSPWVDMEAEMQTHHIPLFSLESKRLIREFDLFCLSLPHELNFSNALHLIKLAEIPLLAKERTDGMPFVMGGGPGAYNPEPLADFFDCFLMGDGEEAILEMVATYRAHREEPRETLLRAMATIEGVYVPSLYQVDYHEDGTIQAVIPRYPDVPARIQKRIVKDLSQSAYPTRPIIPYLQTIHDRADVEVMRGCPHLCRFCHASYTNRPVRFKSPEVVLAQAKTTLQETGYEEISLLSLSSADHPQIETLSQSLETTCQDQKISLALPSTRLDKLSTIVAQQTQAVRKGGLTLAPEAGSERLRDVVGKDLSDKEIFKGIRTAFQAGIEKIKLYFIIGLPSETEADLQSIVEMVHAILKEGEKIAASQGKNPKRTHVTVSLSTLVPKAHTPFQWEPQISVQESYRRQQFLKDRLHHKRVEVRWHQAENSYLEGIFSRGDRRLGKVLERAIELGCKFDSWMEHFRYDLWQQALTECGINPDFYLTRSRPYEEVLPWDHLDPAVPRNFLIREHQKSLAAMSSEGTLSLPSQETYETVSA